MSENARQYVDALLDEVGRQIDVGLSVIDHKQLPNARVLTSAVRISSIDLLHQSKLPLIHDFSVVKDVLVPDPVEELNRHFEARRRLLDVFLSHPANAAALHRILMDPDSFRDRDNFEEELNRRVNIMESGDLSQLRELLLQASIPPLYYTSLLKQEINDAKGAEAVRKRDLYRPLLVEYQTTRHDVVGECFSVILVNSMRGLTLLRRVEVIEAAFYGFNSGLERFDRVLPYSCSAYVKWWILQAVTSSVMKIAEGQNLKPFHYPCNLLTPELAGVSPELRRDRSLIISPTCFWWCI